MTKIACGGNHSLALVASGEASLDSLLCGRFIFLVVHFLLAFRSLLFSHLLETFHVL